MIYLWTFLMVTGVQICGSTLFRHCDNPNFAGENIALGQHTEQSGDYFNQVAGNAVDGNTDTSTEYGTCSHSEPSPEMSWWRVYFDKPYIITGIIIYSRSNAHNRFRLKNFEITGFSEHHYEWIILYNDTELQLYNERIIVVPINKYRQVEFDSVTVSVPPNYNANVDDGNSMLTVCEVEIYTRANLTSANETERNTHETHHNESSRSVVVVGIASGLIGMVTSALVLLTIWFIISRRKPKETYTDLRNNTRNIQMYDHLECAQPPTSSPDVPTDAQANTYEVMN